MKAIDYLFTWMDNTYGGSKEIGDWTNEDVIRFAEDYKSGKFLNGDTEKREKKLDCYWQNMCVLKNKDGSCRKNCRHCTVKQSDF